MRRLLSFFAMALTILSVVFFALPSIQEPTLGIEFEGGYEIVYKISEKDGEKLPELQDIADVIADRIDIAGVKNPQVSIENSYGSNDSYIRVSVASKNTTELAEVLTLIESDTEITFTDGEGNIVMDGSVLKEENGAILSYDSTTQEPIVLLNIADTDTFGKVTGDLAGGNMMAWIGYQEATENYIGDFAAFSGKGTEEQAIAAARKLIVNATVSSALTGDTAQITGSFTAKEASQIGKLLSAGNMDFNIERTDLLRVDGALGAAAFTKSIIAGLVGLIAIIIMMIILYRVPGIIASLVLVFYTATILLVFNLIGGEYGPDTIAAIVIGLGMAVDCCIILFERLQDELYKGRSVKNAYKESTKKSLSSILDANITTIIAGAALYFFGKRSVKGFATMLLITTVFNVLIMLLITRLLMFLVIKSGQLDDKKHLFGVHENKIPDINKGEKQSYFGMFAGFNFMKPVKKLLIVYASILVLGIGFVGGSLISGGSGLNFGLDFLEGSTASINISDYDQVADIEEFQYIVDNNGEVTEESVRYFLNYNLGFTIDPSKVSVSKEYNSSTKLTELSIKIEYNKTFDQLGDFAEKVETELAFNTIEDYDDFITITQQTSTPTMAKATVINALLSLGIAFILIILYIAIRFRYTYAIASVLALVFDVVFTLSIFAVIGIIFPSLKIETDFVSAILAIVGYSINNTVVIFDRVREISNETNYGNVSTEDRYQIVNKAIQNCAPRSLWTTVSTVLPVVALIFIGSSSTLAFSIAILSGLISGVASSLFVAPWFWLKFERRHMNKLHEKAIKAAENAKNKKSSGPEEMTVIGIND